MADFDMLGHPVDTAPMNVSLTPELVKLIEERVASGLYTSASEVVREALRLLAESDRQRSMRVHELREHIAKGLASAKAGRLRDGPAVVARVRAKLDKDEKARPRR
jgi:antitoxin ParD1/3/4